MTIHAREALPLTTIRIRPLEEQDLDAADRIFRVAFGTFLGLPEPTTFMGDADLVATRWRADPSAAFAAEVDGRLAGANFAANWGSVGFFGPLTVTPELWGAGVGKRLMEPVMESFERWGTRHAGLFTFAQSPKHVGLYQRFGFWPGFLIAVMSRHVEMSRDRSWTALSEVEPAERESILAACRDLTDGIHEGLDLSGEIRAVARQRLGDTVLVWEDSTLLAMAVCHVGPATEAGSDTCFVKFGAVRPGPRAERGFGRLLDACNSFAAARGVSRLVAGVSTARREAYRTLRDRGFRTDLLGVAMHRRDEPGYDRPGVFVLEDWR
jgi:GNAT superfamily N-acetyltransferase